jgi:recombination protein RecR
MNILPETIQLISNQFTRFQGIGGKTAQRMALNLIRWDKDDIERLGLLIQESASSVGFCEQCHLIASENLCPVCQDKGRDENILCIVEDSMDVLAIEKTGLFNGYYHVLGGHLSPLDGIGPEQLNLQNLKARIHADIEIIFALNTSVEGETTSLYLQRLLSEDVKHITRLARGIPVGGELEYTDVATLTRALEERHSLCSCTPFPMH